MITVVHMMKPVAKELAAGKQPQSNAVLHVRYHTPSRATTTDNLQLFIAITSLYDLTLIALKLSLGFFLLRIFTIHKISRYIIYFVMVSCFIIGMINLGWTVALPCQLWVQFFPGLPRCKIAGETNQQWFGILVAWAAWTAITDIILATMSIRAVMALHLPRHAKLSAVLLLALGTVGGLASIVRIGLLIPTIPGTSTLGESLQLSLIHI